jgi:hypothetical protein
MRRLPFKNNGYTRRADRTAILLKAFLSAYCRGTMNKFFSFMAAAARLTSIGTTSAKAPGKLTDGQLYKAAAGAANLQFPLNTAVFANGGSGPGGLNQFSPLFTATVIPTNIHAGLNLFAVF